MYVKRFMFQALQYPIFTGKVTSESTHNDNFSDRAVLVRPHAFSEQRLDFALASHD